MKKLHYILLPVAALFLLSACDLSSSSGNDLVDDIQSEIDAAGAAESSDSGSSSSGGESSSSAPAASSPAPQAAAATSAVGGGFLWKPVSESTGGLVILTPASTRGRTQRVATISGAFGSESAPMRHEHHNGGRPHFYFDRPGAAYGTNITVQVPLTDGSVYSVVVPNGAARPE